MWNVWGPVLAVLLGSYLGMASWTVKRLYRRLDHLDDCLDEVKEATWRHLSVHHPHLIRDRGNRWTT